VLTKHIRVTAYPDFFISFNLLFKQPVQEADGRAVLLSLSPFGCLPDWLGRN